VQENNIYKVNYMVDVKKAVATAVSKMKDVYGQEPANLLVEEIEQSEEGKHWLITLGFTAPPPLTPQNDLQKLSYALRPAVRLYKVVKIDSTTGEFVSMKMREAQAA
jgi:hypothetical protein